MNARIAMRLLSPALVLALCGTSLASPGLDVRSVGTGPIVPGGALAGPPIDPSTQNGQWFLLNSGLEDYSTHEFHDNIDGFGGGPINQLAIEGVFAGYTPGPNGLIGGYNMSVSITNNTPNVNGPWANGANMHGEDRLAPVQPYVGTLYNVRFSAHWADDGNPGNFVVGGANLPSSTPTTGSASPGTSNTIGLNYDSLAWYSYTAQNPGGPQGSYQVPTWDFGNIPVGQTVTRLLSFHFYDALNPTQVVPPSTFLNQDLLIARTNDIKIASYFQDDPVLNGIFDRPIAYPPASFSPLTSGYGNSSVFFSIPTPGTAMLTLMCGLASLRRRRQAEDFEI